jgi:leucyl/phenylalanyl-tRNA--protein transferase
MRLSPELMLRAYASGVFPMAEDADSDALHWFDPDPRGVLPLGRFHVPKRLARAVRQGAYEVRVDTAFAAVIEKCGPARPGGQRTWLNRAIAESCVELFHMGLAHSVEAWQGGRLAGGLYGVALGGAFFGESMFSEADNASKVALVHLAARLKAGGFTLLDTQFVTGHLRQFGALEIPRAAYRKELEQALCQPARFHCAGGEAGEAAGEAALVAAFLQSTSQIS